MRSNAFKSLALVLLMVAGVSPLFGQTTNIIDWNSDWKYHQENVLPAVNWMATNYNDSAWPSGIGVLGFPANENLVIGGVAVNTLLSQTGGGGNIITYYFRTTFVLPTTNNVTLQASNLLDDGAVIYLNGREVARPGMGTGTISHTTQATRGGEISDATHGVDTFSIPISFAKVGTNVVAVEVHQNGTASSDMIMGMRIVATIPSPPVILQHPQDTTADAGTSAQFSVVATGTTPLTYRWYTNGILVANQTGATLTTPTTSLSMNGIVYHVTVSNRFGLVTSSNAVLTVVQDLNGPAMISATVTATNAFEIRFNETITQASSTNVLNYVVHELGTTNKLDVILAQWGINISRVRLDRAMDPQSSYVVCIYNISDQRGNITSGDCIGITGPPLTNDVFGLGQVWHFTDRVVDNTLADTNWTALTFDDSENAGWGISSGLFWNYIDAPNACSVPFTQVVKGARTHYYRRKFTVSSIPAENITLVIRHAVDDGAVFYVNETEVGRFNMPAGPVNYGTIASGAVGVVTCNTLLTNVPGSLLRLGNTNNIMAVEVHQQESAPGDINGDAAFDAALGISYRLTPSIPALTLTRVRTPTASNITITWVGTGWQLQTSTSPAGPTWQNLASQVVQGTNRYITTVPNTAQGQRFYRLRQ